MAAEAAGSLAEEAAKLIAALQGWAADRSGAPVDDDDGAPGTSDDEARGYVADHHSGQHISAECRYCPLCTMARLAKAASPEVRDHLTSAALSVALAVKGLLEGIEQPRADDRRTPVEKIDLLED